MTQEEKQLLLTDLCARLPHCKIICKIGEYSDYVLSGINLSNKLRPLIIELDEEHFPAYLEHVRPYLRPMNSMTDEETNKMWEIYDSGPVAESSVAITEYLYERHLDCHYLIEKGLAIEAPEDMYQIT